MVNSRHSGLHTCSIWKFEATVPKQSSKFTQGVEDFLIRGSGGEAGS